MAGVFDFYAGLADTFPFEEPAQPTMGGEFGLLVREPVGVVGAIIPWNAPIGLISYKIAPALLAGCTVVLKSSPEAPGDAYLFAEIAEDIGLPPGVLNVVTADREVSELLVRNPGVDKITFTGSTAAGRRIASLCGERIARCTLELGGKSAAVILDDMDLAGRRRRHLRRRVLPQRAGVLVADPASSSPGRATTSSSRRWPARSLRSGSATRSTRQTQMGPLAMSRQRDRVEGYIAKGIDEGATLATGGGRPKDLDRGYYIEPTVFANVDNHSTIAQEEIFGPVLSVIPADNEDHAVATRQRHDLRAQRLRLHQRRRPGTPGRRAAALGHGRAQRLPHRLRHGVRRLQAVGHRPRGRHRGPAAVPRDQDRDPERRAHEQVVGPRGVSRTPRGSPAAGGRRRAGAAWPASWTRSGAPARG